MRLFTNEWVGAPWRACTHVRVGSVALLLALMLTTSASGHAQARVVLRPSDARSNESFNYITGVRELANGTVLVVDARDSRVAAVNFGNGVVRTIGRPGSGPGEYRSPARIFALYNDSSLLTENGGRWFLMSGDSIVSTVRGDDAVMTRAFGRMALGADARGGVLALSISTAGPTRATPFDPVPLARISRSDGAVQSLAVLRPLMSRSAAAPVENRAEGPGGASAKKFVLPAGGTGHVVAFCDGWTAVVRRDPFAVEWIDAAGKPAAKTAPQALKKLTPADHAPVLQWLSAHTGYPPTTDVTSVASWPSHAPRIVGDAESTIALANGMLLVHQPSTAASPGNTAQVYTRRGTLHTQLTMPRMYRVVGSGRGGWYIAVRQGDGTERLQRHPAQGATDVLVCGE